MSADRTTAPAAQLPRQLWAPFAWIDEQWQTRVRFEIDAYGHWSAITADVNPSPADYRLPGPTLPGLVNAHSHAFQRGFAGLTHRRDAAQDDFWSWREQMYSLALRINPEQLRAIAALLYTELLEGGYTQVCEFHYLHHDRDGRPHADPFIMSRALGEAAADTGIGLTLLPVLYERAGFSEPDLAVRQRRFRTTVREVLAIRDAVRGWHLPNVSAGVAIHSLRAASPDAICQLVRACEDDKGPIHIHVAEQQAEVRDCLAATGQRPIAWLAANVQLDARWHLVHATHAAATEIDAIAATGAGVVVCPSTEADLGDGRFHFEAWRARGVPMSIGSDSHVQRNWPQELRLLEYGQRLALERRNIAADPGAGAASTGAALVRSVLGAGAAAAGFGDQPWGLKAGARADCLVLDPQAGGLLGVAPPELIDAALFACEAPPFAEVWVAGRQRVAAGLNSGRSAHREAFVATMQTLAATTD